MKPPALRTYLVVFALGACFVTVFYQGLPFDFIRDYLDNVAWTSRYGYQELLALSFIPLSPGWFFMEDIVFLRPFGALLIKALHDGFGASSAPFYAVEALACGLLACAFFFLIRKVTRSALYAWLGVLLYLSYPANFVAESLYPSLETFFSLLRILPFLCLVLLMEKERARDTFGALLAAWFICVLLAIKTKSSEKLLVPVFLTFLAAAGPALRRRLAGQRLAAIAAVALAMIVMVPPLGARILKPPRAAGAQAEAGGREGPERKQQQLRSFSPANLYRTLIHHPSEDFALTSPARQRTPLTFTGMHGFAGGWLFWISVLGAPLAAAACRARGHGSVEWALPYGLFFTWSAFVAVGLASAFTVGEVRYLNFLFVPAIPLFFASLAAMMSALQAAGRAAREAFRLLAASCIAMAIVGNFRIFVIDHVYRMGGMKYAVVKSNALALEDLLGRPLEGHELHEQYDRLAKSTVFPEWHDTWASDLALREKTLRAGDHLYFLTHDPNSRWLSSLQEKGYRAELARHVDFLETPTLAFAALRALKRLTGKPASPDGIYAYRLTAP